MNKISKILYHAYIYIFKNNVDNIKMHWFNMEPNFGDSINPFIAKRISKKNIIWVQPLYAIDDNYLCIGPIIDKSRKNSIIWGSGFISNNPERIIKPKMICAVRGPKSRKIYMDNGIECPEVYGDPALLLPIFYMPDIQKKYKLGIVPHYADKSSM